MNHNKYVEINIFRFESNSTSYLNIIILLTFYLLIYLLLAKVYT